VIYKKTWLIFMMLTWRGSRLCWRATCRQ